MTEVMTHLCLIASNLSADW